MILEVIAMAFGLAGALNCFAQANTSLSNLANPTSINLSTLTFSGAGGLTAGSGNLTFTPGGGAYSLFPNQYVGIGTSTPLTPLHVVEVGGTSTADLDLYNSGGPYGGIPVRERVANGTVSSPTAVQSGNAFGGFCAQGYNGSAFSGCSVSVRAIAAQNWSTSAEGSYLSFFTTPSNNVTPGTEQLRLWGDGGLSLGNSVVGTDPLAGNFIAAGNVGVGTLASATSTPACFNTSEISGFNAFASCSAAATFNALSPLTTEGDLLYYHSSANTRLGIGAYGSCVVSNGTDPLWGSCSGTASTAWSSLTAAIANVTIPMGTNNTTFSYADTSTPIFALNNTTASTNTASYPSPTLEFGSTCWTGSTSGPQTWSIAGVPGAGYGGGAVLSISTNNIINGCSGPLTVTLGQPLSFDQENLMVSGAVSNGIATSTNTDNRGHITLSSGTGSYTFKQGPGASGIWTTAPVCIIQDDTTMANISTSTKTVTTSTLTITGSVGKTDTYSYICWPGN
jgi:hypothetical protein